LVIAVCRSSFAIKRECVEIYSARFQGSLSLLAGVLAGTGEEIHLAEAQMGGTEGLVDIDSPAVGGEGLTGTSHGEKTLTYAVLKFGAAAVLISRRGIVLRFIDFEGLRGAPLLFQSLGTMQLDRVRTTGSAYQRDGEKGANNEVTMH
jgi:hypothetical protein